MLYNDIKGKTNYGQAIGILMLNTVLQRVPGDIGNATTFPFPVAYRIVKEASPKRVAMDADPALVEAFFTELPAARPDVDRISWLAAHHHTYTDIGGIDHQILLEADYLVNADEQGHSRSAIENFRRRVFRTASGTHLLDSIYLQG